MIRKHIARALRAEQRSAQLAVHRPAGQPERNPAPVLGLFLAMFVIAVFLAS